MTKTETRPGRTICSECKGKGIKANNDTCMDCGGTGVALGALIDHGIKDLGADHGPALALLFEQLIRNTLMSQGGGCLTGVSVNEFCNAVLGMVRWYGGRIIIDVEESDEPSTVRLRFHGLR